MTEETTEQSPAQPTSDEQIAKLNSEVTKLREEAASHRVDKTRYNKDAYILAGALKSLGVDAREVLNAQDRDVLSVEDGVVKGHVSWTPPKPKSATTVANSEPANSASNVLTVDKISNMSPQEVNENWEEVKKVLKQQPVNQG